MPSVLASVHKALSTDGMQRQVLLLHSHVVNHEDVFFQLPVEKCRLNVQLMQLHVLRCHHCKQSPQRCMLAHWCADLVVVHALSLLEAFGDQSRLVSLDVASGVLLGIVHPLDRKGAL